MAQAALFGFDFRHGHADNSLTASVCPARMAAQQDLAAQQGWPWQDKFPAFKWSMILSENRVPLFRIML